MPSDAERWRQCQDILAASWEIAPELQDRFLADQARGDADLLGELQILASAARAEEAWQAPPDPVAKASDAKVRIGPYAIERVLGRGGMGTVYLARRDDGQFEQHIAIKIIGLPYDLVPFRERFRRERQILARLSHSNIARLFDGGTTEDGELYLVMEYVDGPRITTFADERRLSIAERLRLFRGACAGVEFAHQNLIIHRDIKPSNILVDSAGTPKLLDFGTAKIMVESDFTGSGVAGMTIAYASPEQLRGEPVSTLTDVFSLGALLYELLTGRKMLDDNLAARFAGEAKWDPAGLDADLQRIVAKAAAADPAKRYASVDHLSEDVARYLENRPILARPPGIGYVLGKFFRRNWLAATFSSAAVVALCATTTVALNQRRLALDRYADMRSVTTSLLFELKDAIQDVPGATQAQQILVNRALKNLDKLAASSNRDPALQLELAEAYRQLGDVQGDPYSQNLGDPKGALQSLDKAATIASSFASRLALDDRWARETGLIERTIAEIQLGMVNPREAARHAESAVAAFERRIGLTRDAAFLAEASATIGVWGDILGQPGVGSLGSFEKAAAKYRQAQDVDQRALQIDPAMGRAIRGIALYGIKLGDIVLRSDPESALGEFENAIAMLDRLPAKDRALPVNRRFRANFVRKKGEILAELQQWESARAALEEARDFHQKLVSGDPKDARGAVDLASCWLDLGLAKEHAGDYPAARDNYQRFVDQVTRLLQTEPDNKIFRSGLGHGQYCLASTLDRLQQSAAAGPVARQATLNLRPIAESSDATELQLQQAAEAFACIRPVSYRDPASALGFAKRAVEAAGPKDVMSLTLVAKAYDAAGDREHAKEAAKLALSLMAPRRGNRVPFTRQEMERLAGGGVPVR